MDSAAASNSPALPRTPHCLPVQNDAQHPGLPQRLGQAALLAVAPFLLLSSGPAQAGFFGFGSSPPQQTGDAVRDAGRNVRSGKGPLGGSNPADEASKLGSKAKRGGAGAAETLKGKAQEAGEGLKNLRGPLGGTNPADEASRLGSKASRGGAGAVESLKGKAREAGEGVKNLRGPLGGTNPADEASRLGSAAQDKLRGGAGAAENLKGLGDDIRGKAKDLSESAKQGGQGVSDTLSDAVQNLKNISPGSN